MGFVFLRIMHSIHWIDLHTTKTDLIFKMIAFFKTNSLRFLYYFIMCGIIDVFTIHRQMFQRTNR
jgi:hypothetical protein